MQRLLAGYESVAFGLWLIVANICFEYESYLTGKNSAIKVLLTR